MCDPVALDSQLLAESSFELIPMKSTLEKMPPPFPPDAMSRSPPAPPKGWTPPRPRHELHERRATRRCRTYRPA